MSESSESAGTRPTPKCKALLLCDQTIVEEGTGKVSVIGIFGNFALPEIPGQTNPFTVYVQLTDGIGRYEITMELWDLRKDMVVAVVDAREIEWVDRLAIGHVFIPVPPLPIQRTGPYDLVVLANGQEIDRQRFTVSRTPPAEQQGESSG